MKILQFLMVLCLSSFPNIILAQNHGSKITIIGEPPDDNTWMGHSSRAILESMRLRYEKSVSFDEVKGSECFREYPKLAEMITCTSHLLHSKDREFIAFIPIYKVFNKQDSIYWKKRLPGMIIGELDKQHLSHIKIDISASLGKDATINLDQYVTYYSPDDAKRKFNADSAISVPIKLDSANYYKGKYNNLEALYLHKQGRGFVNIYCFYTDAAKTDLFLYKKAIEGIFRYED